MGSLRGVIGLSSVLILGCSGSGDGTPLNEDGGGQAPGPSDGAAFDARLGDASTSDASTSDASTADAGPDPLAGPPYERIALPVRRLSVRDNRYCVILEDRTLDCGGITPGANLPPPAGNANRDFTMVVHSRTANDLPPMALRRDGTIIRWSWSTGSVNAERPPGDGYIGLMLWGPGPTETTICGLTPKGKLECAGEPAPVALFEHTFVQVSNTFNTPWGLTPQGELLSLDESGTWLPIMPESRFVSFDHGHYLGACGVDTEGALRCFREDGVQARNPRDYSLGSPNELCLIDRDRHLICRSTDGALLINGRRVWQAPVDDEYVDVDTDGAGYVCGVTTQGVLKCFEASKADDPGQEIALPMPAATSD